MSLSLYGVPDGQQKGQSARPCPSVYSPTTALGSLSSVALSSAPALKTLTQRHGEAAIQGQSPTHIWSGFLGEATGNFIQKFMQVSRVSGHELIEIFGQNCPGVLESLRCRLCV